MAIYSPDGGIYIDGLKEQLCTVDGERWSYLLQAKIVDLELSPNDGIALGVFEEEISAFTVLRDIAGEVSEGFEASNRRLFESEPEDDEESITLEDLERLERIYDFGITLACLSICVLSEPEQKYLPLSHAVTNPQVVELGLKHLYDEDTIDTILEVFCAETFSDDGRPIQQGWIKEYPVLSEMSQAIGMCAGNNFDEDTAFVRLVATAGAAITFAALKNVIDSQSLSYQFNAGQ